MLFSAPLRPATLALAALDLAALSPSAAHAQTQDLFVSNGNNTISRFAGTGPGTFSTTPTTLSGGGLDSPEGLAFDVCGDLFAANVNTNSIVEFTSTGPGTFAAAQTVETGLNGPSFLAFGPSAPRAVPEASTTVSLGLLLMLGMGGLVVAARKKRRA